MAQMKCGNCDGKGTMPGGGQCPACHGAGSVQVPGY
jgi:DnaJ-class molecular chaperone